MSTVTTDTLSSSDSRSFERLNHSNYHTWESHIKAELMKHGVWRLCSGEEITLSAPQDPGEPGDLIGKDAAKLAEHSKLRREYREDVRHYNEALQRNDRAIGIITQSVEPEQLVHFKDKTTAKEVWDAIKVQHTDVNANFTAFYTKSGILEKKYTDGEDLQVHFNSIVSENRKLGVEAFDDKFLAELLLVSLPRDSVNWRSLTESLLQSVTDTNPLKSEDVVKRCMALYQQLNPPSSKAILTATTSSRSFKKAQSKKESSGGCGYCGYPRHVEEVCRKKKKAAKASGTMGLNKDGLELETTDVEKGLGEKRKNMADLNGEVHIGEEELSKLQTKGLKDGGGEEASANGSVGPAKKRRR